jgi:hypothetical protein
MSRGLDTANLAAVNNDKVAPILFAELDFASGIVRVHSGIGTVSWGGYDWSGVGTLGSIEGLDENSDLTRKTVNFTLTGIPNDLLAAFLNEHYQGRSAKVYIGFFDNTTYQLVANPANLFIGKMDNVKTKFGKTFSISLSAENRMASWNRPVVRRYNDADQQSRFPGDLGLQFITQAATKEIVWGRKT